MQPVFPPPAFTKTRMDGEPWADIACTFLWISIHRVSGGAIEDISPGYRDRGCPGKVSRRAQAGEMAGVGFGAAGPASPCCLSPHLS